MSYYPSSRKPSTEHMNGCSKSVCWKCERLWSGSNLCLSVPAIRERMLQNKEEYRSVSCHEDRNNPRLRSEHRHCRTCCDLHTCTYPLASQTRLLTVREQGSSTWEERRQRIFDYSNKILRDCAYPSTTHQPETLPAFYMCFVDGPTSYSGHPTYKHTTKAAVMKEAERLAKLTCKRVYVLAATDTVKMETGFIPDYRPIWRSTDR